MKDNEIKLPQNGEAAPHASEHHKRHAVRRPHIGEEAEMVAERPAEAPSEAVTPSEEAPKASRRPSKKKPDGKPAAAPAEALPPETPSLPAEPTAEEAHRDEPLPVKEKAPEKITEARAAAEEAEATRPSAAKAAGASAKKTANAVRAAFGKAAGALRASPVGAFFAKVGDKLPKAPPKRILSLEPNHTAASLRTVESVRSMRIDMLVTLLPMAVFAVYLFGFRVLTLTALSVLFCYLAELACNRLVHKRGRLGLESAVLGVVLVLGMPPTAPLWLPVLAALLAVLPFRLLFDGKLRSWVNPAVAVLLLLRLIFPAVMNAFCAVGADLSAFGFTSGSYEAAEATVLETILKGTLPAESLGASFVGLRPGLIGDTSALLLLAAAVYLGARKLLRPAMPLFCLLTVGVLTYFFPTLAAASDVVALRYAGYHLFGSDLLFGLLFLASDPLTAPRSARAGIAAGIVGGLVTVGVRYFIAPDLGVLVAALVIGLIARPLDLLLRPSVFGGRRKKKA